MSLDDQTPTQYFGDDAVLWKHPDTGVTLSLSPAQARHAIRRYLADGYAPDEADTGHVKGCAFGRTARCTCTYMKQWNNQRNDAGTPDYTAPTFRDTTFTRSPELQELHDTAGDHASLFKHPGTLVPKLQLPFVIASGHADPAEVAEKIVKDNPQWFGELPAESYIKHDPLHEADKAAFAEVSRQRDTWRRLAHTHRNRAWVLGVCAAAGWAYSIAIVAAGKGF